MSRSASLLGSITTRDTVDSRPGTVEFRAGAPAADTARRRVIPFLDDVRSTCGPPRSARDGANACAGSQDSHTWPYSDREALTHDHERTEVQHS